MNSRIFNIFIFAIMSALLAACSFNTEKITEEDYLRAERALSSYTSDLIYNTISGQRWTDDDVLLYQHALQEGTEFMKADPATGTAERAFDHDRLAKVLSGILDEDVKPLDLPFRTFDYVDGRQSISFSAKGETFTCDLSDYECTSNGDVNGRKWNESVSPDGTKAVFIQNHNLYMRDLETGRVTQLTYDGEENFGYATNNAGWVKRDSPVVLWSPDSKRISTFKQDARGVKDMYLASTKVGHPELETWKYPFEVHS